MLPGGERASRKQMTQKDGLRTLFLSPSFLWSGEKAGAPRFCVKSWGKKAARAFYSSHCARISSRAWVSRRDT